MAIDAIEAVLDMVLVIKIVVGLVGFYVAGCATVLFSMRKEELNEGFSSRARLLWTFIAVALFSLPWTSPALEQLPTILTIAYLELATFIIVAGIKFTVDFQVWTPPPSTTLAGEVAVVTGANRGIGLEVARQLADLGATVVLACRSVKAGRVAADAINARVGSGKIEPVAVVIALDLSSMESVRKFAAEFKTRFNRLDLLVNNAGFGAKTGSKTVEGYEACLGVMHFGHFLLTRLLEPVMLSSGSTGHRSRIINVASCLHLEGRFDKSIFSGEHGEGDLRCEKTKKTVHTYARAKLANILFSLEHSTRLKAAGVDSLVVNSCHPGAIATGIWDVLPQPARAIMKSMNPVAMRSSATAASLIVGMCVDEAWGTRSNLYANTFLKPSPVGPLARDTKLAAALWDASCHACGLPDSGLPSTGSSAAAPGLRKRVA